MVEGASIDVTPNDVTGVMSEMSGFEKHSKIQSIMPKQIKIL